MRLLTILSLLLLCTGCTSSCQTRSKEVHKLAVAAPLESVGDVTLSVNRNVALGYPSSSLPQVLISRDQYVISWNQKTRDLNWSEWEVTQDDLGSVGRSNHFAEDQDLAGTVPNAVLPTEYKGTCFDRGHQTPSGDRTDTREHNANTFYMSNMIPQTAYLNRVTWEHLEAYERELVRGGQDIYVIAGPIFGPSPEMIGPSHDIAVPAKDFKIITDDTGHVLVAVIMPNVTSTGSDPITDHDQACADSKREKHGTADDWKRFITTVADIEGESGLSFSFLKVLTPTESFGK